MGKLPDLEKLLAKVFTYSIKHRIKAIYFEDVSLKRLTEFRSLLRHFSRTREYLKELMSARPEYKSSRLQALLSTDDEGGVLPHNYLAELAQFEKLIIWKRIQGTDKEIPEPQAGLDKSFDDANERVNRTKAKFADYLAEIRERVGAKGINYSHTKFRYELEVPEHLVQKRRPDDFELTSRRAGFERFHTPELKQMVEQLEVAEEALKDAMVPFLCAIFSRFHEQKDTWVKLVSVLAEVDALMSLAIASGE